MNDSNTGDATERRIRERARHLWLQDGCPEGGAEEYRKWARELLAIEDNPKAATKPRDTDATNTVEPVEAVENQGEFPTLTDQGEETTAPERRTPRTPRRPMRDRD